MEQRVDRFRRQVEDHFAGRPGRGARYPEALKAEAVAITRTVLAQGGSVSRAARRLGLGAGTLKGWLESPVAETADLRPVELIDGEEPCTEPPDETAPLVLITAAGHRVEGLTLEEVVVLVEALG